MHGTRPGADARMRHLPQMVAATAGVVVLPGLVAGTLEASGVIDWWWLTIVFAVALSTAATALGSALWARRPAAHEVVFADLMAWAWVRRVRAERRVESARWLLGSEGRFGPELQGAMLERLSGELEARDARVHGHSKRVAGHAHMIAEQLGLPDAEVARIRAAGAIHDVGKIETPRDILNKPGRLSELEFAVIKRHPARGAQMVSVLGDEQLTAIVRHHHERLDGRGYPDGLSDDQIPLGSRVIAVADTFDALTSDRPYRAALSHRKAFDVLRAEAGTQLDGDAVEAFLTYYSGRRWFPWVAVLAAAPSRLAAWAVSGIQGAGAASLAGGVAALGGSLLLGGALTSPQADHRDPAVQEKLAVAAAAPASVNVDPPRHGLSHRNGGGVGVGAGAEAAPRQQVPATPRSRSTPTPTPTSTPAPSPTSSTQAPPNVIKKPAVPGLPALPAVPKPSALPPVQLPGLPPVQVPQVQLPKVQLPSLASP